MAVPRSTSGPTTIERRIAKHREALTPTEHRLAALLTDDPMGWGFATVAEVAARADTSGPTVVRFAAALGFSGFGELQDHVRAEVTAGLRRPNDRLRQTSMPVDHSPGIDAVTATFERLDDGRLEAIAQVIADAGSRVWIVASESSSPVAHLLATNLRLIRPGIVHVAGSSPATAATIADASSSDAAIAIDFPRYEHSVVSLASTLHDRGVRVVALTDGPLSPLVDMAEHWVGVSIPSIGPFDSAVPTIAVAEVVVALVAERRGENATRRLDAVERQWDRDRVFVPAEVATGTRR